MICFVEFTIIYNVGRTSYLGRERDLGLRNMFRTGDTYLRIIIMELFIKVVKWEQRYRGNNVR